MNERKRRSELGCAAMLFSPIFFFGSLALANASPDSESTSHVVWSWILLIIAVTAFTGGGIVWMRNRRPADPDAT